MSLVISCPRTCTENRDDEIFHFIGANSFESVMVATNKTLLPGSVRLQKNRCGNQNFDSLALSCVVGEFLKMAVLQTFSF